ncbi:hypothetical protein X943_002977 [Babesia divergens]|uniref:Uncharacterized protein n=1 Tax=Babesia divergens TaxID=32595 RepID=A0AAD9LF99_BABDI|nr:hypothetical protein X943_002977 [Babesia divergens]
MQNTVLSTQGSNKGQESSGSRSDPQSDKVDSQQKGKSKATYRKKKKNVNKERAPPQESSQAATQDATAVAQTSATKALQEPPRAPWEAAIDKALQDISSDVQKFAVVAERPVLSSVIPQQMAEDLKVLPLEDENQSSKRLIDAQPSQYDVYYQMSVLELLAFASCVKNNVKYETFKVVEKRNRTIKTDDPKSKYRYYRCNSATCSCSVQREHGRYREPLTPFEPQLMNMAGTTINQPLQSGYPLMPPLRNGMSHETMGPLAWQFGKHGLLPKDKGTDWKTPLTETQQNIIKQHVKPRNGGGSSTKWLMPKATDGGIFSLGSLTGNAPTGFPPGVSRANMPASNALKNITQLVHDLHLKKKSDNGSADDVMCMSTSEVSNFTFFDETANTPIKSSQFSKFFSTKCETTESGTYTISVISIYSASEDPDVQTGIPPASGDVEADAKNRQRANQLLQLMLSRKA